MSTAQLKFDASGLVTVVVQDRLSGEIRMLAHADRAALEATLRTGEGHFYSRSRQRMWRKGEESGNVLKVHEIFADCDGDALVYLVDPVGPSCHTGRKSCFFQRLELDASGDLSLREDPAAHARALLPRLWAELEARRDATADRSYTRKLLDGGADKVGAKLREEADELARAIAGEADERVVSEAADLVYHLLVGLLLRGRTPQQVQAELARRFGTSGIDEKASRG